MISTDISTNWRTLIDPASLHAHLSDPALVIVDCRFELGKPNAGRQAWLESHLPGARYADLERDLSGPVTATSGRHPLPDVGRLGELFCQLGISADSQVVAYDADNGAMAAARLWWLLRWLGHDRVSVLNGGFKAWRSAGLPLSNSQTTPMRKDFVPQPRHDRLVSAQQLRDHLDDNEWRIIDARSPERYSGLAEPIDPVAGHIPGAINHPLTRNVDGDGRFLTATELRSRWASVLGARGAGCIVSSCGSGVTACHNLLSLEIAGIPGGRLYAGSWSEWCKLPGYPIGTGSEP